MIRTCYTQMTSRIGFCQRRTATEFKLACIAKLFKFSCFGAGKACLNSGRLLGIFPILEVTCVYKMFAPKMGRKVHSATPIASTIFRRMLKDAPFTQARYSNYVWPGIIGGLAMIRQDTAHAAPPPPISFSTTKTWSFPNITGGAIHSISARVQGQAIFSAATGKVECIFTLSVTLHVAGVRDIYPVEQSGRIGFIGRDKSGNVLWDTPKGYYSPGSQHEVFSVDKELLEKTARVDVLFDMTQPTLTQNMN